MAGGQLSAEGVPPRKTSDLFPGVLLFKDCLTQELVYRLNYLNQLSELQGLDAGSIKCQLIKLVDAIVRMVEILTVCATHAVVPEGREAWVGGSPRIELSLRPSGSPKALQ